ncbi:hypothetical protein [Diaphorobacter nitroreducens]
MKQTQPKQGFNLSRWALEQAALPRYLMVVLMVLGIAAYFQQGKKKEKNKKKKIKKKKK